MNSNRSNLHGHETATSNCGYLPAGKHGRYACCQHASLPQQKSIKGIIKDMPALAAQHQLTYPSIIIIGKVTDINTHAL